MKTNAALCLPQRAQRTQRYTEICYDGEYTLKLISRQSFVYLCVL